MFAVYYGSTTLLEILEAWADCHSSISSLRVLRILFLDIFIFLSNFFYI
jgi:hypothetical protein